MAPSHWDIYADELRVLDRGRALFYPERPVIIGDVGYVRDGSFQLLFNAIHDPPERFTPLNINLERCCEILENDMVPGKYPSGSIAAVKYDGHGNAGSDPTPTVGAGIKYRCKTLRGAILELEEPAEREQVHLLQLFETYARENWASWYDYAKKRGHKLSFGDVMIVTGCCRTSAWNLAVCSSKTAGVSFYWKAGAGFFFPTGAGGGLSRHDIEIRPVLCRKSQRRGGQLSPPTAKDQTVFIKGCYPGSRTGYLASHFRTVMQKVRGGDGGHNSGSVGKGGGGTENRNDTDFQHLNLGSNVNGHSLPGSNQASMDFNPAVALLAHKFETTNEEVVVVHDDDWCISSQNENNLLIVDQYASLLLSGKLSGVPQGVSPSSRIQLDETSSLPIERGSNILIAVIGAVGAGKSSFIQQITGDRSIKLRHGVEFQCTSYIEPDGRCVTLIDTPGFDDSREGITENVILKQIASFLGVHDQGGRRLDGIIYLYRITDSRMGGILTQNLQLFKRLCGSDSLQNVVVVTTHWDTIDSKDKKAIAREHELVTNQIFFQPLIAEGAWYLRYDKPPESARQIMERFLEYHPTTLQIQTGIDKGKKKEKEKGNSTTVSEHGTQLGDGLQSDIPKERRPDIVVAVMGPTGAGKSAFIKLLTNDERIKVGNGVESETSNIQFSNYYEPDGRRVTLIDTPGFDGFRDGVTDKIILEQITGFLDTELEGRKKPDGLIYLDRVTNPLTGGISARHLRMFKSICGLTTLNSLAVVTTRWDMVKRSESAEQEAELMTRKGLFKPLVDAGSTYFRHNNTVESARKIMEMFLDRDLVVQTQKEFADDKNPKSTTANLEYDVQVNKLIEEHTKELERVRREMTEVIEGKDMELKKALEERERLNRQLEKSENEQINLRRDLDFFKAEGEEQRVRFQEELEKVRGQREQVRKSDEAYERKDRQDLLKATRNSKRDRIFEEVLKDREEVRRKLDKMETENRHLQDDWDSFRVNLMIQQGTVKRQLEEQRRFFLDELRKERDTRRKHTTELMHGMMQLTLQPEGERELPEEVIGAEAEREFDTLLTRMPKALERGTAPPYDVSGWGTNLFRSS